MRLIDADTLNYVRVRIYHDDGTIGGYNAVVPSSEIKNAPTVDAEPVRHGKWILWRDLNGIKRCKCSECIVSYGNMDTPYCPNCGAKMDGEMEEE